MKNFKFKIKNWQRHSSRGMTYIELIVVLSIFAVMTSMVLFNYSNFQANIDIKNLASDIALEIVQAQKQSLSGLLPPLAQQQTLLNNNILSWKPSYGVYFNSSSSSNKSFIYFADLYNNNMLDDLTCTISGSDCLNQITITRGNDISGLSVFYSDGTSNTNLTSLTITFARPNSGATITPIPALVGSNVKYAEITVSSPDGKSTSSIEVETSGRIQIN
jgi:prepilin-type N-terminal cleavage/methylation domain-containing protein